MRYFNPKDLFILSIIISTGLSQAMEEPDPMKLSPERACLLGVKLLSGLGGSDKNPEKGLEFLASAANRGHYYAQYKLGEMCLNGGIALQDQTLGLELLHRSADEGFFIPALMKLGKIYLMGIDVPVNIQKAQYYFDQAIIKQSEADEYMKNNPNDLEKLKMQIEELKSLKAQIESASKQ